MADIKKIVPGQTVYSVAKHRMGNTMIRTVSVYAVKVVEVDPEGRWVWARWNGNPPERFYGASWRRWKIKEPITVKSAFGSRRLASREEIAALKVKHGP